MTIIRLQFLSNHSTAGEFRALRVWRWDHSSFPGNKKSIAFGFATLQLSLCQAWSTAVKPEQLGTREVQGPFPFRIRIEFYTFIWNELSPRALKISYLYVR